MSGALLDRAPLTRDAGAPRYPGMHPRMSPSGRAFAATRWLMRASDGVAGTHHAAIFTRMQLRR